MELSQDPMNAPRIFPKDNYLMKITLKKELLPRPTIGDPYLSTLHLLSLSLSLTPLTEDYENRRIPLGASSALQNTRVAPYVLHLLRPLRLGLRESSSGHWPLRLRGVCGTHQSEIREEEESVNKKSRRGRGREQRRKIVSG